MSLQPTYGASTPVVILDDVEDYGRKLQEQLLRWHPNVEITKDVDGVIRKASDPAVGPQRSIVFVIDINLGKSRELDGLQAIAQLEALRKKEGHSFYIAALTTNADLEARATEAGADVFLTKDTYPTDALELQTRLEFHEAEVLGERAKARQADLAEREFKNLKRRLKKIENGDLNFAGAAVSTVNRALGWPLLMPNQQIVLSLLLGPLAQAEREGMMDQSVAALCVEGVELLIKSSAEQDIGPWVGRMTGASPEALMPWIGDTELGVFPDWN